MLEEFIRTAEIDDNYGEGVHRYIKEQGFHHVLSALSTHYKESNPALHSLLHMYKREHGFTQAMAQWKMTSMLPLLNERDSKTVSAVLTHPFAVAMDTVTSYLTTDRVHHNLDDDLTYVLYSYEQVEDTTILYAGQSLQTARNVYKESSRDDLDSRYMIQIWNETHHQTLLLRADVTAIVIKDKSGDVMVSDTDRFLGDLIVQGKAYTDIIWLKQRLHAYNLYAEKDACSLELSSW